MIRFIPVKCRSNSNATKSLLLASVFVVAQSWWCPAISAESQDTSLDIPSTIVSEMPYDVDKDKLAYYLGRKDIPAAQRLFDIYSWQMFIALNSPAKAGWPLRWENFRGADTIFLPDGEKPKSWDEAKPPAHQLLDEYFQAFRGPLVDQNGKWVRYEVLVNKTEFDYIYENELYSLDGQVKYTGDHLVNFPTNSGHKKYGSIEIKLAWKQLGDNDDPSRFLVRQAYIEHVIANSKGNIVKTKPTLETVGLVGMHISARTESSPTWIWATFEHIDNVNANDLEKDSKGRPLHPNFSNPATPTKVVNQLAPMNAVPDANGVFTSWAENHTTNPTQVLQYLPVPAATDDLNNQIRTQLKAEKNVLQYYKLIGTQWPVKPSFPAFAGGTSVSGGTSTPESIIYKTPGMVVPVYLGNNTMETFFQDGNQTAGPLEEDDRLHDPARVVSDPAKVFGTESCNGCHFSAGAAVGFKTDENGMEIKDSKGYRTPIFGKNGNFGSTGNANYCWMLQIRAKSKPVLITP